MKELTFLVIGAGQTTQYEFNWKHIIYSRDDDSPERSFADSPKRHFAMCQNVNHLYHAMWFIISQSTKCGGYLPPFSLPAGSVPANVDGKRNHSFPGYEHLKMGLTNFYSIFENTIRRQ